MSKLRNVQGCTIDHPTNDALGGGASHALPLGFSQSQPDSEGAGRQARPPFPVGSTDNPHYQDSKPLIIQNFPQPQERDSSYYVQYTANLHSIDERLLNSTTKCSPQYLVLECGCGRHAVASACYKKNCISCRPYTGMKKARAVMKKFSALSWTHGKETYYPNIIYTVFTIPIELREQCIDPKFVRKLRAKAWQILRTVFHADFAVEATHPISEKNPETFHPHLNFLWKPIRGRSPYIDFSVLRTLWANALNFAGTVNLYSQFSNKPAKIWKWCKYVTRLFPEFSSWLGSIKWYGNYPKASKEKDCLCPICRQKITSLGYLRPEKVSELLEHDPRSGRAPPKISLYDVNLFIDF